jgi:hypothetical protein
MVSVLGSVPTDLGSPRLAGRMVGRVAARVYAKDVEWNRPVPDAGASQRTAKPIFDFALAEPSARPRPQSLLNDGVARPTWADPGPA